MVSIVVVSWNTRELLRKCLESVSASDAQFPIQTIVIDNASHDGSAAMVEETFPDVVLVQNAENLGYARGNNQGISRASGEYVLTLNPDTELPTDALRKSVEILQSNHKFGCLAPRLIGLDRKPQRSIRGFPSILGVFGALTGLDHLSPEGPFGSYSLPSFDYASEGPAPQPMGTYLMFRRSALEAVGDPKRPFDEAFPIFFNEVDLLYRLHEAGIPCLYTPRIEVLHAHGASTRQRRKAMVWESHRSLVRYFRKHLRGLSRAWVPLIAVAASVAALVRARGFDDGT
ncbi:MAG: glycosyltransferase family 2 protein [Fimbriimonadaceae bacterium]